MLDKILRPVLLVVCRTKIQKILSTRRQKLGSANTPTVTWITSTNSNFWQSKCGRHFKCSKQEYTILFRYIRSPNKEIGHFTQVVRDNADRIGCYISQFNWPGKGYTNYLVCDYSNTNNICLAVYETGAPGSKCKTGTNPKYPALCSESEEYDHKTPVLQLQPGEPIPKCFQEQGK